MPWQSGNAAAEAASLRAPLGLYGLATWSSVAALILKDFWCASPAAIKSVPFFWASRIARTCHAHDGHTHTHTHTHTHDRHIGHRAVKGRAESELDIGRSTRLPWGKECAAARMGASRTSSVSALVTSEVTSPRAPARAVRPQRWT